MMIFVFGSNEAGIHGAGAARTAMQKHGAKWGKGFGIQGNSFAIPTKDKTLRTLPIESVKGYIKAFLAYAKYHTKLEFQVTRIGCGLAGFRDSQIAPLFENAPSNCLFDEAWLPFLGKERRYWGTF